MCLCLFARFDTQEVYLENEDERNNNTHTPTCDTPERKLMSSKNGDVMAQSRATLYHLHSFVPVSLVEKEGIIRSSTGTSTTSRLPAVPVTVDLVKEYRKIR
jgi:hypothetical protein